MDNDEHDPSSSLAAAKAPSMTPSTLPSSSAASARARSTTTPGVRSNNNHPRAMPSVDSLHAAAQNHSQNYHNVIKKRHSTYTIAGHHPNTQHKSGGGAGASYLDRSTNHSGSSTSTGATGRSSSPPPPVPELPPHRPPRNPARSSTIGSESVPGIGGMPYIPSPSPAPSLQQQSRRKSPRPSTATGATGAGSGSGHGGDRLTVAREDITPWEFQSSSPSRSTFSREDLDEDTYRSQGNQPSQNSHGGHSPLTAKALHYTNAPTSAPSIRSRASSAGMALSTSTGPISDVTPWELYPVPNNGAAGNGAVSVNTQASVMSIAALSHSGVSIGSASLGTPAGPSNPTTPVTPRKSTLATGPVEDVTPWDLAPGPLTSNAVVRNSIDLQSFAATGQKATNGKSKEKQTEKDGEKKSRREKMTSRLKSKRPMSLAPIRASRPSSGSPPSHSPPNPYISTGSVDIGGGGPAMMPGLGHSPPPLSPSRRSLPYSDQSSHYSGHGSSHHSHAGQYPSRSPPPPLPSAGTGHSGGTDKEITPTSLSGDRQRQQPLTGPLEDVAPWEMHPGPSTQPQNALEGYNRARSASSLSIGPGMPPPSPSFFLSMSAQQQGQGHGKSISYPYAHDDGRSMSSSGLSMSSKGGGRNRANSVAASLAASLVSVASAISMDSNGGNGKAKPPSRPASRPGSSSAALGLSSAGFAKRSKDSGGSIEDGDEGEQSDLPEMHDFSGASSSLATPTVASSISTSGTLNGIARGRSSTTGAGGRPGSAGTQGTSGGLSLSASTSAAGAASIVSSMSAAQMEEVTPWELHPVPVGKAAGVIGAGQGTTEGSMDRTAAGGGDKRKSSRPSTSSSASKALADFGLRRRRSTGGRSNATGVVNGAGGDASAASASGSSAAAGAVGKDHGSESGPSVNGAVASKGIEAVASKGVSSAGISFTPVPDLPSTLSVGIPAPMPIAPIASTSSTASAQSRSTKGGKDKAATAQGSTPASDPNLSKFSTADRTILEELKANIRAREAQYAIKGVGHTIVGGGKSPGKRYHPYPKEQVPYPRSYDKEVVDLDVWETMNVIHFRPSSVVFDPLPARVLEIGCGTGTWILQSARTWKNCHFVGLDIVPLQPNLQNMGFSDLASRITWVQENFLDGLPFQNEEFDFVRIKRIGLGVPEDKWDPLLEEIARVMKPGGAFEMIEDDLFFPGKPADDDDDDITFIKSDRSLDLSRNNSVNSSRTDHSSSINGSENASTLVEEESPSTPRMPHASLPVVSRPATPQQTPSKTKQHPSPPSRSTMILPHSRSAARPSLAVKTSDYGGSKVSLHEHKRDRGLVSPLKANPGKSKTTPFLLRPVTQPSPPPHNPRDHTILGAIWTGMLDARFVNMTLTALLPAYLEHHFQEVRTCPPVVYTFPSICHDSSSAGPRSSCPDINNSNPHLSDQVPRGQAPSQNAAFPTISLDESRSHDVLAINKISPATEKTKNSNRVTILPTPEDLITVATLNLHLCIRAKEIIACSEPMWEWVESAQASHSGGKGARFRSGSIETALLGSAVSSNVAAASDDLTRNAILEMTREDFDQILNNFQMDMQDKAQLGPALKERFHWKTFELEPLQDRKAFDEACNKYDQWLISEASREASKPAHRSKGSTSHPYTIPSTLEESSDLLAAMKLSDTTPRPSTDDAVSPTSTLSPPRQHDASPSKPASPPASRVPNQMSPERLLSRVSRIFVAWKADR